MFSFFTGLVSQDDDFLSYSVVTQPSLTAQLHFLKQIKKERKKV